MVIPEGLRSKKQIWTEWGEVCIALWIGATTNLTMCSFGCRRKDINLPIRFRLLSCPEVYCPEPGSLLNYVDAQLLSTELKIHIVIMFEYLIEIITESWINFNQLFA